MSIPIDDSNYILSVKYFLYYLFNERPLSINPKLHETRCVVCTKGKTSRIVELKKMLVNGNKDEKHEVESMINYLKDDGLNDTTITVSGSTVVYKNKGNRIAEFDGVIIYPYRECDQVVLIEAKNTKDKPSYGKKCLIEKLEKLEIPHETDDIKIFGHDAYFLMTI